MRCRRRCTGACRVLHVEQKRGPDLVSSNVSRKTLATINGQPACARCGRRPVRPSNPWAKRKRQSYCSVCHADINFERREGKVQVLLYPEEWAEVKAARAAEAIGRHAAKPGSRPASPR